MKFGIREIVFLIVLVAMPVSFYWFVFKPRNEEIDAAMREITHKEHMLDRLDAATAQSEDLARTNDEIAGAIALVESRLPDDKEVEVILEQVAELARKSDLTLPKVKTGKQVSSARFMEQPLDMSIRGDFNDFYGFLLKLEKLERITRVLDLELDRIDKDDGAMQAEFTLSIYFEPQSGRSS